MMRRTRALCRPPLRRSARADSPDRAPRSVRAITLHRARRRCDHLAHRGRAHPRPHEIRLGEHIRSAKELVLENFLERLLVIQRGVCGAAAPRSSSRSGAKRPAATAAASATAITPSTVISRADRRPIERLEQGLWQCEPRRLDQNVVGPRLMREQSREGGLKSSATVQQMLPLASSTTFCGQSIPQPLNISPSIPTSPNSFTITASRLSPRSDQMTDQRSLARTEESGDHRARRLEQTIQFFPSFDKFRGNACNHAFAKEKRALLPRNDAIFRGCELLRGGGDLSSMRLGLDAADEIGPFILPCEANGAGPFADCETLDRAHIDFARASIA